MWDKEQLNWRTIIKVGAKLKTAKMCTSYWVAYWFNIHYLEKLKFNFTEHSSYSITAS